MGALHQVGERVDHFAAIGDAGISAVRTRQPAHLFLRFRQRQACVLDQLGRRQDAFAGPDQLQHAPVLLELGRSRLLGSEDEREHLLVERWLGFLGKALRVAVTVVQTPPVPAPAAHEPMHQEEVAQAEAATASSEPSAAVAVRGHRSDDQHHEDDEVDDQHHGRPDLEARLERGPRGLPEADAERLPVPRDQFGVELVEKIARVRNLQVAAVGLEEALEGRFGVVLGQAGRGDEIPQGSPPAQSAKRGGEGGVRFGGGRGGGNVRQGSNRTSRGWIPTGRLGR